MSTVHVWSCGQCGAPVTATVGTIVRTFAAHAEQCPALQRPAPRVSAAAKPDDDNQPA